MLKHKFGANYQALGRRSFETRNELPEVPGLTEEDYEALWERMRKGEDYASLRKLLEAEGLRPDDLKWVMQWLDDQALRYFPVQQEFRRARIWVWFSLALMIGGAFITYAAQQAGYSGLLPRVPFIAGAVVFVLSFGKFRRLRAQL